MEKLILILAFFGCLNVGFGQDVDTVFVRQNEAGLSIWQGKLYSRLDTVVAEPIDAVFDTVGLVDYLYSVIERNEKLQGQADLIELKTSRRAKLYQNMNALIVQYNGSGYIQRSFEREGQRFLGYYRAKIGQTTSFFQLKGDGTSIEVDNEGREVQGGLNGQWYPVTNNRFRIVNHFPAQFVPAGTTFTRTQAGEFQSPDSGVVIKKIQ